MPGVLIIEAMAQAAAVLVGVSMDLAGAWAPISCPSTNAASAAQVVPGDAGTACDDAARRRQGLEIRGPAIVDGELAAEAEIMAMLSRGEMVAIFILRRWSIPPPGSVRAARSAHLASSARRSNWAGTWC